MKIQDLINVETLHGAGFDKVREVHAQESEDYFGNPVYLIWILMDSSLQDEDFRLKKLSPMLDWAYARAWEFGAKANGRWRRLFEPLLG